MISFIYGQNVNSMRDFTPSFFDFRNPKSVTYIIACDNVCVIIVAKLDVVPNTERYPSTGLSGGRRIKVCNLKG